jgi:hypothetical protein
VFTGADGSFRIDNVPAGTYSLAVEFTGISVSVPNIVVANAPVTLDPISVGTCGPVCVPSAEVCDGIDNDCDGVIDNGNAGGGQACSTGMAGACGVGVTACVNGALTCNATAFPQVEVCDGLDNDCDGQVDEGNPGGGMSCNTGKAGVCSAGTTACTNGAITCNQNTAPSAEVCDGIDNNCDGQVDGAAASASCPVVANGTAACTNAACAVASCAAGFANCDGNPVNGCERNLRTDVANCGACGVVCAAGQACSAGVCVSPMNNEWQRWQ